MTNSIIKGNMFYEHKIDKVFRFGDVVRGFASSTPILTAPLLNGGASPYKIEICSSPLSVILSPCCSIDKGILALVPLQRILPSFYQNPWWVEDFTRLNCKMPANKSVPPHRWEKMPLDVKERELDLEKDAYAYDDFFVYEENPLLPEYTMDIPNADNQQTRYYMIDFKTAYQINCDNIKRDKEHPIDAKLLQLSKKSRADLRDKIAAYFARIPAEDQV